MKRMLLTAVLLLSLTACRPVPEEAALRPEGMDGGETTPVPVTVLDRVDVTVRPAPGWKGSEIQQGPPITPQPGDTAERWDPARAADFPRDRDCTPAQLLEKWMTVEGLTWEALDSRGCDQLILVAAEGSRTITTCYSRQKDGTWAPEADLTAMEGFVGSGGIAHNRKRGTRKSPAGLWAIGSAFGLREPPEGLRLPWRPITPQSDWVGDARSPYFNTWQERDDPGVDGAWNRRHSEHLADFEETYTYACVIEYNTPPYAVPDRGFAIFFHVSDHPTSGCVALEEADMVRTLQWLNPHRNPHILVTGSEQLR